MRKTMRKIFTVIFSGLHLIAALILIFLSVLILGWTVYEILSNIEGKTNIIPLMLQAVGAVIISAAIVDVAQYMIEEEVFSNKELCKPEEARKTITKIIVIIAIAISIEGLVFVFKAGRNDLSLVLYPSLLILVSAILIVALGLYQKLSATVEKVDN
ncbi:MAG: hypothetical protein ACI9O4_000375 [Chitinophagales bacterium]|jgi:hypothetical protein